MFRDFFKRLTPRETETADEKVRAEKERSDLLRQEARRKREQLDEKVKAALNNALQGEGHDRQPE